MSIDVSTRLAGVLAARTFRMVCRATVVRGSTVLAADLPVDVGREEADATLRIPERVTLTIPRVVDGVDWSAGGVESPLMPFGQRVHVKLGIGVGADGYEWINRGEFLLQEVDFTGTQITLTAVGLLALVSEARMVAPYKPTGTIGATIRKLVEPALNVVISPDLTDRAVAAGLSIDEDRLQGVLDLLDAWPARAQVTPDGYLLVLPAGEYGTAGDDIGMSVQRRHDPDDPTARPNVTEVATSATREGVTNAMVVRGQNSAGAPIQGVAYDTSGGPASYGGPFNPLPVPEYFSHGTVQTPVVAAAVARAMLDRKLAPFRRAWRVEAVPQPRYLLHDQLVYLPGGSELPADVMVERIVMPYTAASGPMQLTLRELPT